MRFHLVRALLLSVVLSWLSCSASSEARLETIGLSLDHQEILIGPHAQVLEDPSTSLELKGIASQEMRWQALGQTAANFGFSKSNWWVRFRISNESSNPSARVLDLDSSLVDFVDIYIIRDQGQQIEHIESGDRRDFTRRQNQLRTITARLEMGPQEVVDVYLKLHSHDGFHEVIKPKIWLENDFLTHIQSENLVYGIYHGALAAILFYNLFLFISTRQIFFGHYVIYLSMFLLWSLTLRGYTFQYVWPNLPDFNNQVLAVAVSLMFASVGLFTVGYLQTKEHAPAWIHKGLVLLSALSFLGGFPAMAGMYAPCVIYRSLISSTLMLFILIAGVQQLQAGSRQAKYFLLAFFCVIFGASVYYLRVLGMVPTNDLTDNLFQVGSAAEFLLLAFGLADQMNQLKNDKLAIEHAALTEQTRLNNELESLIKTRTEDLENERTLRAQVEEAQVKLRTAMTEVEAAGRAKDKFLSSMSHEIRTPLNGVVGTLDVLSLSELNTDQREQVNTMRDASKALLGIINDILDFSKVEAGKMEINLEPVSIPALLESIRKLYQDAASAKALKLELQVQGLDQNVLCDPLRIRQIVSNLVSNAIKFTTHGSVTLSARSVAIDPEHLQFHLDVIDTGIGIPEAAQSKVFKAFSQADSDTLKRYGGTGLGLAIAKRLCKLMNGSITLRSDHGKGSTFSMEVPLAITQLPCAKSDVDHLHEQVKTAQSTLQLKSIEEAQAQNCLIGIVDDNKINRFVLSRQLNQLGFTCVVAEDGLQALEMWRQHQLALLITDCQMPEMDGYDLSRAIRQEESSTGRASIPILACTASALQGEAEKCQLAGMNDCMTKPLQLPILAAMLKTWMPRPRD